MKNAVSPADFRASSVASPKIVRPSLTPPPGEVANVVLGPIGFAGYSDQSQFEIPNSYTRRQLKLFPTTDDAAFIVSISGEGGDYWEKWADSSWGTRDGDSGGAFFKINADGTRDVVGISSAASTDDFSANVYWANVAGGPNKQWVLDHVTEGNVPSDLQHTVAWLTQHGKDYGSWWGEADYSGPCQQALDSDCDGWYNAHDNCPFIANADQADTNGDSHGDVCDRCPWSADGGDPDGDGICNSAPGTPPAFATSDNCPNVWNKDQANCNERVEVVEQSRQPGLKVLGDKCDPVPCATAKPRYAPNSWTGDPAPPPGTPAIIRGRMKVGDIKTINLAPHGIDPSMDPLALSGQGFPVFDIESTGRFCQMNLADQRDCLSTDNVDQGKLNDFPTWMDETGERARPWLRISTSMNPASPDQNWEWNYDNIVGGSSIAAIHIWNYNDDNARWRAHAMLVDPEPAYVARCRDDVRVPAGTCLSGVLWYNSASPTGTTEAKVGTSRVGIHGLRLSNSYLEIKPDEAVVRGYPGSQVRAYYFAIRDLVDPAPYESVIRHRVRPLFTEEVGLEPRVVDDTGRAWDLPALVSPGLRYHLDTPGLVWVSAAEPGRLGSNVDNRLQAVALLYDGTTVWDSVVLDDGVLKGADEISLFGTWSEYGDPQAPSPRTDFFPVFSKSAGGVFVTVGLTPRHRSPSTRYTCTDSASDGHGCRRRQRSARSTPRRSHRRTASCGCSSAMPRLCG